MQTVMCVILLMKVHTVMSKLLKVKLSVVTMKNLADYYV